MHLSMHNWMRAEPIEVTVRRLARYGYRSIELSGEPEIYDTKEVRKLLAHYGLACWGVVSLMFEGRDLIDADDSVRASSIEYLNGCITMVKELDGYEMTIVPSTVGKVAAMDTPEQEWGVGGRRTEGGLRPRTEGRGAHGAGAAHRFETNFLNRADQAMLLAEEVGPDCGVCIDTFHLNIEEANLIEAIRSTKERLVDFHVADNNRMACGMGALDWPLIVNTLKEIGYDGALTVEFVAPLDRTPANPYKDAVAAAEQELTPEQLQFIQDHAAAFCRKRSTAGWWRRRRKTLLPLI